MTPSTNRGETIFYAPKGGQGAGELLRQNRLDPLHHNSTLRPQQPEQTPKLFFGGSLGFVRWQESPRHY